MTGGQGGMSTSESDHTAVVGVHCVRVHWDAGGGVAG